MGRHWRLATVALLVGGALVGVEVARGAVGGTVAMVLWVMLFVLMLSPLPFPRSVSDARARELHARDGLPIVYWRPGCQYCLRLRLRLGRAGRRAHWVNIWQDPAAAAAVRAVAGGNETVPTVVLAGGDSRVNPDPGLVLAALRAGRQSAAE